MLPAGGLPTRRNWPREWRNSMPSNCVTACCLRRIGCGTPTRRLDKSRSDGGFPSEIRAFRTLRPSPSIPSSWNLARDRVAADAKRRRRFDATAAGMGQRTVDQRALEGLHQMFRHPRRRLQPAGDRLLLPAPSQSPATIVAADPSRISAGRSATSTVCPGAMTVSQ